MLSVERAKIIDEAGGPAVRDQAVSPGRGRSLRWQITKPKQGRAKNRGCEVNIPGRLNILSGPGTDGIDELGDLAETGFPGQSFIWPI